MSRRGSAAAPSERLPELNASHVRCPGCGAPAGDPTLTTCSYCTAALGARACPTCHCRVASGVSYCPWCGTASVTPGLEASALRCPCGTGVLAHRTLDVAEHATGGALALSDCGTCHGMWVGRETIERLVASHADDAILLALVPGVAAQHAAGSARACVKGGAARTGVDAVRYRSCPVCSGIMNRVNYARISGIIVDVCKPHGTWFDAHELPALLDFVRRGGLDAARAKETASLMEERRRLERERLLRTNLDHMRGDRYSLLADRRESSRSPSLFSLLGDLLNGP